MKRVSVSKKEGKQSNSWLRDVHQGDESESGRGERETPATHQLLFHAISFLLTSRSNFPYPLSFIFFFSSLSSRLPLTRTRT